MTDRDPQVLIDQLRAFAINRSWRFLADDHVSGVLEEAAEALADTFCQDITTELELTGDYLFEDRDALLGFVMQTHVDLKASREEVTALQAALTALKTEHDALTVKATFFVAHLIDAADLPPIQSRDDVYSIRMNRKVAELEAQVTTLKAERDKLQTRCESAVRQLAAFDGAWE